MMAKVPQSPIEIHCRGCDAKPGEKCGVVPNKSLLRRRLRAGDPVHAYYTKLLRYFHDMRWRDFNRVRNDFAKLDDWNKRYAKTTEVA
jgi:hypothetical protein